MRTIEKLTDFKFLNINKVIDPENNVRGYFFTERLGIDSVAFICMDRKTKEFLVNREYKPPIDKFIDSAFGGSLDSNLSNIDIVIEEVREEAGFDVTSNNIKSLGIVFVSTQMNQFCHLYFVFVDKEKMFNKTTEDKVEKMSTPVWVNEQQIFNGYDWKSIVILMKAKNIGII